MSVSWRLTPGILAGSIPGDNDGVLLSSNSRRVSSSDGRGTFSPDYDNGLRKSRLHQPIYRPDLDLGARFELSEGYVGAMCRGLREGSAWGLILGIFDSEERTTHRCRPFDWRDDRLSGSEDGGGSGPGRNRQIEEYALLLHYFHKASNERRIVPILVTRDPASPNLLDLNQQEFFPQLSSYWIVPVLRSSWDELAGLLLEIERHPAEQIVAGEWESSPYFPVPSIIDAAIALRSGLSIREIAHSEASEHEIQEVCAVLQELCGSRSRSETTRDLFPHRCTGFRQDAGRAKPCALRRK